MAHLPLRLRGILFWNFRLESLNLTRSCELMIGSIIFSFLRFSFVLPMRRLCRQNVEYSFDDENRPFLFAKYSIFPDRTKIRLKDFMVSDTYVKFIRLLELLSVWEHFLCTADLLNFSTSSSVWRIKLLLVSSTTWRVGQDGRRNVPALFWHRPVAERCSGMKRHAFASLSTNAHKVVSMPR